MSKNRKGYSDDKGSIAGAAKKNALMGLKSQMAAMGGDSLFDSLTSDENAYKDGGVIKASVIAKDEDELKKGLNKAAKMMGKYEDGGIVESHEEFESDDSDEKYSDLSREELLALLQNR